MSPFPKSLSFMIRKLLVFAMNLDDSNLIKKSKIIFRIAIPILLFLASFQFSTICAGEWEDQRILAGLDLFPTLLSADKKISEKTDGGKLRLAIVYVNKEDFAEKLAGHLEKIKTIRGMPVSIDIIADAEFERLFSGGKVAGVFLSQNIGSGLPGIIESAKKHHTIVFSPFDGDVEKGVPAGIFIDDRIHPYVNVKALNHFKIELIELFLEIAKKY